MKTTKEWLAKLDFRNRKTSGIYFLVLVCIGALFLGGAMESGKTLFLIPGAILIIAGFVIYLRYHVCPGCKRFLDRGHYRHCPHCGAQLEDDSQYEP